jgi:hypothetical protein
MNGKTSMRFFRGDSIADAGAAAGASSKIETMGVEGAESGTAGADWQAATSKRIPGKRRASMVVSI